jgi:hypothetical protein
LHRARWSLLAASHTLLRLLVTRFAPQGESVFGLDDTIERRPGEHIAAKGIYRDPVRSSQAHCVQSQWLALALLYGVRACFVGWVYLGIALPDGPLPFGTLPCGKGTSASKAT